jgi:phosphate transport system substrate-binding protein
MNAILRIGLAGLMAVIAIPCAAVSPPDPNLPKYQNSDALMTHRLTSIGSDTLDPMMKAWGTEFFIRYFGHGAGVDVRSLGSGTAPPALTSGKAQLGPMSRAMKPQEIRAFKARHGYEPTPIQVAYDALAVFVNRANSVPGLTLGQLSAIFSSQRACGYPRDLTRWGDLGIPDPLGSEPIALVGRDNRSGTYGYFKKHALCKGDYKSDVLEEPANNALIQMLASTPNMIGYAGMSYSRISRLRAVPLAEDEGGPFVAPTIATALSGEYPLARPLYIYIDKPPERSLPDELREFLLLVLSREGQQIVAKKGYVPLPAAIVEREREKLL